MTLDLEVQYAVDEPGIPLVDEIEQWVKSALDESECLQSELVVRIVDEAEMTTLNSQFRGKQGATNVLSFPGEPSPGGTECHLGDIVICAPVVREEAIEHHKSLQSHWAHMVIHGVLHLQGYDHLNDTDAEAMESRESQLMHTLGFADPWHEDVAGGAT